MLKKAMRSATLSSLAVVMLAVLPASQAVAEDFNPDANWRFSVYLWAMSLEGELGIGPIQEDIDLDFSDLLSALDYGGSILVRRDWGANMLVGDFSYFSLSPDAVTGPLGGTVEAKLKMPLVQVSYGRKFGSEEEYFAALVGARYMQMDLSMTATPNLPGPAMPVIQRDGEPDFVDAIVGGLVHAPIGEKWGLTFQGDVGFGQSNGTWNAQLLFQRTFNNDNILTLGLRAMSVDYDDVLPSGELFAMDTRFTGAVIGYTWD